MAINAKFIHSSLSIRSLKSYVEKDELENLNIVLKEYTINNKLDNIIIDIYKTGIKHIGFSVYIWNIELVLDVIGILKKVIPDIKIFVGGPESYGLIEKSEIDYAIYGEGEQAFKDLILYFIDKKKIETTNNIHYKTGNSINCNSNNNLIELDKIPFIYKNLHEFENRIIYYETSRGCPFNCQYCTSSITTGVRFLSLKRVYSDLKFFIDGKVKQVKFVDRTFNSNREHTSSIWEFLIKNDNGITNFHFEIAADLLNDKEIIIIENARPGLFQFEIGVQSTNKPTLDAIKRKTNLNKLFKNVTKINSFNNIHQHLDLIAGLPLENYLSFKKSFNDVYSVNPSKIQLGFLKILKETGIIKDKFNFGTVYIDKAPYEVLFTNNISFSEMIKIKQIEEVLEIFYNSGKFNYSIKYAITFFEDAFSFYEKLSEFYFDNCYNMISSNKLTLYKLFYTFFKNIEFCNLEFLKDVLKFDILVNDNIKSIPDDFKNSFNNYERDFFNSFYSDENYNNIYFKEIEKFDKRKKMKMTILEKFSHDIFLYINQSEIIKEDSLIFFNYNENNTKKILKQGNSVFYNLTSLYKKLKEDKID